VMYRASQTVRPAREVGLHDRHSWAPERQASA
jgi:hypothetical protein